jgi:hypothetical protein
MDVLAELTASGALDSIATAKEFGALDREKLLIEAGATLWNFYLPDEDRSSGWTNHCYVLQFVCAGYGNTPEEAWASAKREEAVDLGFPPEFLLPDSVVAFRDDAEHGLEVA